MQRLSVWLFAFVFALIAAVPADAQRNRNRDRDDRDDGPKVTENFDQTLSLGPGGTVRLKTFSGRVKITGTGGGQVVIHAVRRATAERLRDIKLEVTQSGNRVEIDANHQVVERDNNNVVETDFEIQVPAECDLDLRTFSAPIDLTGVRGNHEVDGFSSEIRFTDVGGPMRIKTFSGDVSVEARAWADGNDLNVNTFSGGITLRLPGNARGDLSFDTFSGRFNSDLPVTLSSSSRRNFRGTLNGGGTADFTLKTFSGDVTIRR